MQMYLKMSQHLRFIGDIVIVWTKSEKELPEVLDELKTKNASSKFEFR